MKYYLSSLLMTVCVCVSAQHSTLTNDPNIPIPPIHFDANGALVVKASETSSVNDFDFLVGKWKMHHRRLNKRLEGCKDWTEFDSEDDDVKILSGTANMDTYRTMEMPGMEGKLFEGITLRLFDPNTRLWSLYWVASNRGVLDPPMVGSYENGIGHFFARDTYHGKNVIVLFRWDVRDKEHPNWGQAFSPDEGKTWEWNWYNTFVRVP
jgi:hypothetical protein